MSREYNNMPDLDVHRQWFTARPRRNRVLMWWRRNNQLAFPTIWYTVVACAAVFLFLAMPWQMWVAFAILFVEARRK